MVQVVGDVSYSIPDFEIDHAVEEMTSEHDGKVNVLIVCGPVQDIGKKVIIHEDGNIFIALFQRNFIGIFEENALNIKELIYIIDNVKVSLEEFLSVVRIDVCDE